MSLFVPYLTEEAIERDAEALLAEFAQARGVVIVPPIPIEDIVEKHLKLRMEFDDTHRRFNVPRASETGPDILGAIFSDGRIVIDESLDPEDFPRMEQRYHFTVAHESGHWRLHQQLIVRNTARAEALFICRSSQAKRREEWQADFYASCLLMPRDMVLKAWKQRFGNTKPLKLEKRFPVEFDQLDPDRLKFFEATTRPFDERVMELIAAPFADTFKVSRQAMRIRLEKLGLLSSGFPKQQSHMAV